MPRTFLTHPAYTCMAASCFFFSMGFFFFLVYCGQYALEIGAGDAAPYVLIACNAASLLGRISSGVIADKLGYFNILILELLVTVVIIFAWIGIKTVPALFVAAVFYGLVTGGNIALQGPCVIAVTRDLGCAGTLIGQLYGQSEIAYRFDIDLALTWDAFQVVNRSRSFLDRPSRGTSWGTTRQSSLPTTSTRSS